MASPNSSRAAMASPNSSRAAMASPSSCGPAVTPPSTPCRASISAASYQLAQDLDESAPSLARAQRRTFDLQMDLAMLRQLRSHDQPFGRGSPAMEQDAVDLANTMLGHFAGVTKKPIRDRVLNLIGLFAKGDEWKRRMEALVLFVVYFNLSTVL